MLNTLGRAWVACQLSSLPLRPSLGPRRALRDGVLVVIDPEAGCLCSFLLLFIFGLTASLPNGNVNADSITLRGELLTVFGFISLDLGRMVFILDQARSAFNSRT